MTVLDKRAASGIEGKKVGRYIAVAVAAVAIGVTAAVGFTSLLESGDISPTEIAQVRGAEFGEHLENQWIAQVSATKNADLVNFYAGLHAAELHGISEQRSADMVDYFSNQNLARVRGINEQRAQDMVEFKWGWAGEAGR